MATSRSYSSKTPRSRTEYLIIMLQIDGRFMSVLGSVDTDSVICELSQRGNRNLPDDNENGTNSEERLLPGAAVCRHGESF